MEEVKSKPARWQRLFTNVLFLVGLGAIVAMVVALKVSPAQLWHQITGAGWWLLVIMVLWTGIYLLNTLAWRAIIRGSGPCPITLPRLWQLVVTGYALNSATSIGLVSGEPYRIMQLSRFIGGERASSSVVLFVMMHTFSHFWFWLTGIVLYLLLAGLGMVPLGSGMGILLAIGACLSLGGIWLFLVGYRKGLVLALVRALSHIPFLRKSMESIMERYGPSLTAVDKQIAALHGQRRRNFYQGLLLEYGARIAQCAEIFLILCIFGQGFDQGAVALAGLFVRSVVILAFTSLFANLLGFIPLQLGGREGGFAITVAGLGMAAALGLSVSIICRLREIAWDIIGVALMRLSGK
mgnify:CR=1 FL=1